MHCHVVLDGLFLVFIVAVGMKQDQLAYDDPANESLSYLRSKGRVGLKINAELGVRFK